MRAGCSRCSLLEAEIAELRVAIEELKAQLVELDKLCSLQEADIQRLRGDRDRPEPNRPERVPADELQLAFTEVIASFATAPAANDDADEAADDDDDGADDAERRPGEPPARPSKKRRKKGHGRRPLALEHLAVEECVVDPPEVTAAGREGFVRIGEEVTERVAHRPASYFLLRHVLTKWARVDAPGAPQPIVTAPLPPSVWPRIMADPSTIAQIILAKYDLSLPLHRQERASPRLGFYLPRSTQCGWLAEAYGYVYRVVDAMMVEAKETAHCIATDATGAPLRTRGPCSLWHVFVFLADRDHVIFRAVPDHTSAAIAGLLDGFKGHLLVDASSIYDALGEAGIVIVYCWAHVRRYFWRCRETDPDLANEALAILGKLFEVERDTAEIPMPARTDARARRARPILALFDAWIGRVRPKATPRTPLAAAVTYYDNQREGLRRFLADGRLRIDNNLCEQQLRNLVLGRRNWTFFENANGLRWYAVFRSLIASCALHDLEPAQYLEELLRLAPHWPARRILELSPKYWAMTRAALHPAQLEIIRRPWEPAARVAPAAPHTAAA